MYFKNKKCAGEPMSMKELGMKEISLFSNNKCTKTQNSEFLKVTTTLAAAKKTAKEKADLEKKYSYWLISLFIVQILCCIIGIMFVGGKVHRAERELVRDQAQYYSTLLKVH